MNTQPIWDAIVVGGGVVGCAVLRELAVHRGWRCLLVEASSHLAAGASSGNTGIACMASDVSPGTLEHACLSDGEMLNLPTWQALNVPHRPGGSMYVGFNDEDLAVLARDKDLRSERGDDRATMLTASEARAREPGLDASVAGALLLPGETVVDPWLVPLAYARHAHENGATIRRATEVTAATWGDGAWALELTSTNGGVRIGTQHEAARVVVACGGLRGDALEGLHRQPPFAILPRRGDFVLFEPRARTLLGAMPIGQVPSATSRGVYVWTSVHGVVACGPTAEQVDERRTPPSATSEKVRAALRDAALTSVPRLADAEVIGTYAGLRPGSNVSTDYLIERPAGSTWVSVGGIRSTGLTAALGISRHVADLCEGAWREGGGEGAAGEAPLPPAEVRTTPLPPVREIVASYAARADGSVVFGADEMDFGAHHVTHPLTAAGFDAQLSWGLRGASMRN